MNDSGSSRPVQSPPISLPSHTGDSGFVGFGTYSTAIQEAQDSLALLGVSIPEDVESDLRANQRPQPISFTDLPLPLQESCLFVLRCLPGQRNAQIRFVQDPSRTNKSWNYVACELIAQSLQQTFGQLLERGEAGLEAVATILCNNTAQPFRDIYDDPRDWLGQFCGANLRWESLGLLWANMARISDIVEALHRQSVEWLSGKVDFALAQFCLGYCIDTSRFLTGGNDLLLDLARRKTTLDSIVSGDGSKFTLTLSEHKASLEVKETADTFQHSQVTGPLAAP
jgi:hypothetical protein